MAQTLLNAAPNDGPAHRAPVLLTRSRAGGFGGRIFEATRRLGRASIDLVYPPSCAFCSAAIPNPAPIALCGTCHRAIAPADLIQCPRCAAIANLSGQLTGGCARCLGERFRFDRVFALGRYDGELRDAVLRMKHAVEEPLMMAMGRLLAERFGKDIAQLAPDVVVPIPMHWSRRFMRGANSAELMGQHFARTLGLTFAPRALRRRRRTRKLAELSLQERKRVLRDAFCVARGCSFEGAHAILVDDVLTTGTTCDVAARKLKKAGAAAVTVVVAARAFPVD
jgi:ComF family protein